MDAKAKVEVEAWQYRFMGSAGWSKWAFVGSMFDPNDVPDGYEVRALIPLTDHEAALMELRAESQLLSSQLDGLKTEIEIVAGTLQRTAHALSVRTTQLETLLTGLEALAGEWERDGELPTCDRQDEGYATAQRDLAASLRRTLTNSAKESGNGN